MDQTMILAADQSAFRLPPSLNHTQEDRPQILRRGASKPVSVLFVCLGNICRSPMAEGVFRRVTKADTRVGAIDSAGTGAYHEGCAPDPRTMTVLADNGETEYDHSARKVRSSDFRHFDYILAMDGENLHDLTRSQRRIVKDGGADAAPAKVMLFGDFGGRRGEEVIDPYYGARDGFTIAYEQMTRFTKGFIEEVLSGIDITRET
ncbi:MAG: hypothetical protein Q9210_005344 [Variospora velana]